jgi:formylglycine-generating enzyme required for sulfatase activity
MTKVRMPIRYAIAVAIGAFGLGALLWPKRSAPLAVEVRPAWIRVVIPNQTVHNGSYLESSFLYQVQTALGATAATNVLEEPLVRRRGRELYLDPESLPRDLADRLRRIAASEPPADEMSLEELTKYTHEHYYEATRPYPSLAALRRERPYLENPDWLTVPVESANFHRLRVLRIEKDRIADALIAYFANRNRVLYPEGTLIVAESIDKQNRFVEAEVLAKRADGFWNFSAYDEKGSLTNETVEFDDDGQLDPRRKGPAVPQGCAFCHRVDRLDFSGDPESPVVSPVRGYFHRLPARVPQIHLGPEYYDHMAFTELTEANARVKDAVFGVYGSLLLSELAGRKRLGVLSAHDEQRYLRLQGHFPELLTPLTRVDSVVNSLGERLLRIPASKSGSFLGSRVSDPEVRADEARHPSEIRRDFFMAQHAVTNAEYRRFDSKHRSGPYRSVDLDGDDQPVVNVRYDDALAFVSWLNEQLPERQAGRTYRLPTEEEWEHAAKGGDDRRFPWGDQWPPPEGSGNFGDETTGTVFTANWPILHGYRDGYVGTSPVGRFAPNPYLLYDMAGNVYQWTASFYLAYPGAAAGEKPYGAPTRVIRGSSWADELPKVMRCAFRNPVRPDTRMAFLGFRLVADIAALP